MIQRAEDANPEIISLRARLEAARLEVKKAEGGHYPTVDAVAQYIYSSSENVNTPNSSYTNKTIGVQVVVPLFSGGYVSSTVRQALAQQQQAEEVLEATRRDLGVRVHKEFRGVTEGVPVSKRLSRRFVRPSNCLSPAARRTRPAVGPWPMS